MILLKICYFYKEKLTCLNRERSENRTERKKMKALTNEK